MTRIKICGITNREDLEAACAYGADAVGFIFVPGSPRYVGEDKAAARELIGATPPLIARVGVFDEAPFAVTAAGLHLDAVQYYRATSASAAFLAGSEFVPMKACRMRDAESLRAMDDDLDPARIFLLDTYSPNALGGTGHTFNWDLANEAKKFGRPIALAGGLTPENVADAIAAVRPYMVDVSSGVEAEPGRKDHDKLRQFIRAVREADLRAG